MPDTRWTLADVQRYLTTTGRPLAPGSMALEGPVPLAVRDVVAAPMPLEVELALELHTEGNTYVHGRTASKRNKAQRQGVYTALCRHGSARALPGPLTITITRRAPRLLGATNLMGACKHVIDGITDWLTSQPGKGHYYDDDPRFTWRPQQEKTGRGVYTVHIRIEETR